MSAEWVISNDLKVTITEFKGKKYVDIRKYYDSEGEQKPTKKGITLSLEEFTKIINKQQEIIELTE